MKKLSYTILTVVMLLSVTSLFAQGKYGADSANCVKYLNFYRDYYRQNNYQDAAGLWRKAMESCPPTASQNMLIHGRQIMTYLINTYQGAPEGKQALIDSLLMISDIRAQYYPSRKLVAMENKAFDMVTYEPADNKEVLSVLDEIITMSGNEVNPDLLVARMDRARQLYELNLVSDEEVLNTYSKYAPVLDELVTNDPSDENKQRQQVFDNAFIVSGVANCNNLIKVFQPRFDANPNDLALVKSIATLLSDANCVDSTLFLQAVNAMHKLEPSFNSARLLYRLHASKEEHDLAIKFLQEAIDDTASTAKDDADMLMEMASYQFKNMNSPAAAIASAKKAVELDESVAGKANLLIGTIWYNAPCSGNEIEQRAKFWVATDYLQKAKNLDSSLAAEADELIRNCRIYYPSTEDAFMYDLTDGNSYTVSCSGMSATTTVRTQK